ncbi:hypothetical protein CHUAL_001135 [Chamberlinius hualienensis]
MDALSGIYTSKCQSDVEEELVTQLRQWIETEANFYGRTDETFLLWFVRGCKYDMDKCQEKITKFYENRVKIPKWWANRDLNEEKSKTCLDYKSMALYYDNPANQNPTVAFSRASKLPKSNGNLDAIVKLLTMLLEIAGRIENTHLNGVIYAVDFCEYPSWLFLQCTPRYMIDIVQSALYSTPIRVKAIVGFNCPFMVYTLITIVKYILPPKIRNRIKLYRSNWDSLFENISRDVFPDEYGGSGGSIEVAEDMFHKELLSLNDFFQDDNKYGFPSK